MGAAPARGSWGILEILMQRFGTTVVASPMAPIRDLPMIVFADDDDDDAFLLERLLRQAGVRNPLRRFHDGEEIVQYLEGASALPCMVFLDLKMPKLIGFDVLSWIRKEPRLAGVKVYMMSGGREPRDETTAERLGADDYFTKFPPPEVLADLVGSECSGRSRA
jgi:CheY-like chemotaxis protein